MEDMSELLGSLLKNPEIMKQVQELSGKFNQGGNQNNNDDKEGLNFKNNDESQPQFPEALGLNTDMISLVSKLAPILSSIKKEDKNTYLLNSLRPFLGKPRQKKLDESIKMMQLMKILPLLKDSGVLNGLL